jgi:MoaA/NifB/PqqE/SkfB family radical SAM enzyme
LGENTIYKFFAETECSDLSFSIDAATKETYKKIRRRDSFHYVLQNICNYIRIRDELGSNEKHEVRIWNNINLLNVDEMVMMVEVAASLGIYRMIMVPTHSQHGIVRLKNFMLSSENVHIFQRAAEDALKRADQLGVHLAYPNSFDVAPPEYTRSEFANEMINIEVPNGLYTQYLHRE